MHITDHGFVTRSIYAAYWGDRYAVYPADGGLIIARFCDGASIFLQGDDVAIMDNDLIAACDAAGENHPGDDQAEIDAIDRACDEYSELDWSSPAEAGGRPSSDGGTFNFYRNT